VLFADDRPDALVTYRSAMAELVPELRLSGALASDGPASERLMFSTKSGETVSAALLSAGQRQGILIAGTIVRLGLRRSLLLIDQPELHLHAADHESFVRAVERIAGDSQIILATGSSAVSQIGSRDQTIVLRRSGAS
jgi:predicted ATP-dependent endonuclease of OLD family